MEEDAVAFAADARWGEVGLAVGVGSIDHRRVVGDGGELDRRVALDEPAGKTERVVVDGGCRAATWPLDIEAHVRRLNGRIWRDRVEEVVEVRHGDVARPKPCSTFVRIDVDGRWRDRDGPEQAGRFDSRFPIVLLLSRIAHGVRCKQVNSDEDERPVSKPSVGCDVAALHEPHVDVE